MDLTKAASTSEWRTGQQQQPNVYVIIDVLSRREIEWRQFTQSLSIFEL
jgi:hypothetical protein